MDESATAITFDEFKGVLADILMVGPDRLTPEAHFMNDLSVDSIKWLEMALTLEKLGVALSAEAVWDIHTVGDAYQHYLTEFQGGSAA
ncbi:MAG: acyl carrier protein [Anaerolineales bacterium]|jgi:acyl carrier protein